MDFSKIHEYEELDFKYTTINKKFFNSEINVKCNNLSIKYKDIVDKIKLTKEKLLSIDEKYNSIKEEIAKLTEQMNDYSATLDVSDTVSSLEYAMKDIIKLEAKLASLESDIEKVNYDLRELPIQYEKLLADKDNMEKLSVTLKPELEKAKANTIEELKPIKDSMDALAKEIDPKLLQLFQTMKNNKVKYPRFVAMEEGDEYCNCGMELPPECINILKKEGSHTECPHCGKILYRES